MLSRTVRIVEGGKMVIPASFRRELGFNVGDTVIAEISNGELHVRSRGSAIANAQKLMRELVPENVSLVDELIADRRAQHSSISPAPNSGKPIEIFRRTTDSSAF